MSRITQRQQQVLDFIQNEQRSQGVAPSLREIAHRFGFRSMNAAADHVRALRRKGFLIHRPRRARAHQVPARVGAPRRPLLDVPVFGTIPAGFADGRQDEGPFEFISVDASTLGTSPGARAFALRVRGDSMIGRHILDGDYVILEHGLSPRPGDVVAALIDRESTLKTFVLERGRICLRAENPRYPQLIPAESLMIQGVMIGLVRRTQKSSGSNSFHG